MNRIIGSKDMQEVFESQTKTRDVLKLGGFARRKEKLQTLSNNIKAHFPEIIAALSSDLGKPPFEAVMDAGAPVAEIDLILENLDRWLMPVDVQPGPHAAPGVTAQMIWEPRGRVLIFGPWNFPFGLLFQPLVAAVAAGNTAMVKPSEMAPATSAVSAKIIRATFDPSEVAVFEGGVDVATALLDLPFDHIFFTGSTQVGRQVMAAASRHLSTVTLELGGKCPAVLEAGTNIATAASRIAWGKFLNAGQICLAPDHVWVSGGDRDVFVEHVVSYIHRGYYVNGAFSGVDLARIVNKAHVERLRDLLAEAVSQGAKVVEGGKVDGQRIEPTVLVDVPRDCALMREEIFGPILPVLTYDGIDDVTAEVNGRAKPLALYVFSNSRDFIEQMLRRTSSGGVTVNDVLQHAAEFNLPFGGVGASGMGAYHGVHGIQELSHRRSVYYQAAVNPVESFLQPPYGNRMPQ